MSTSEEVKLDLDSCFASPVKAPVIAGNALYAETQAWVRVISTEDFEWGSLRIDLDCESPPHDHWLAHELFGAGSLSALLGLKLTPKGLLNEVEDFLLREGIAPGQPFWLHLKYSFWRDSWTGETDVDIRHRVFGVSCIDPKVATTEWEALIGRKFMLLGQ